MTIKSLKLTEPGLDLLIDALKMYIEGYADAESGFDEIEDPNQARLWRDKILGAKTVLRQAAELKS